MAQAPETFTADEILKASYGDLFQSSVTGQVPTKEEVETTYKRLAMRWHPDKNQGMDAVFIHLSAAKSSALKALAGGDWRTPGMVQFTTASGVSYTFEYLRERPFELGTMFIGSDVVVYSLGEENHDLYANAVSAFQRGFKYANDDMRKEFARYVPSVRQHFTSTKNQGVIVINKTPDLLLLSDVIEYYNGHIDPKHVAWILSSLYNLACFLKFSGITHNHISPETYFISPQFHSGALLGGWWYSVRENNRLVALPQRSMDIALPSIVNSKTSSVTLDLEGIREIGRESIGGLHATGNPKAMTNWLRLPATGNPFDEYTDWKRMLSTIWPMKYVELKLTANDIYTVN